MRDMLNVPKWEPKCAKCRDTGLPPESNVRYNGWSEMFFYGPVCECEAGAKLVREQREAKEEAVKKRAEWKARQVVMFRSQSKVPPRMAEWRLDTYPGDPKLVQIGRDFIEGGGILHDGDREKIGLLLMGPTGVGKTGLAVAVLNDWIREAMAGLFWETGSFLRAIRATFSGKGEQTTEQVTEPARVTDLLVLDDIGDVGRGGNAMSDFTRAEIFDLVNFRYNEQKPTIYTSNLTVKQMVEQFGERTWWRMADMCLVVEVGGKNLRA